MEVKTIQPSAPSNMFVSNYPKIDKRIDSDEEDGDSFELIQPSESSRLPCTSSCSCSHSKTEGLKHKYTNIHDHSMSASTKYGMKTSKYGATKMDLRPTKIESLDKKTQYGPYEYDSQLAPTDRIVEKYTEVINDYSDEKDSNSVEETELLTNEQAPVPPKVNKVQITKAPEKSKPEKIQKPNKNKVLVADLLKLGSLGIKGLSQLAPVIEKMTGGFMKRQDLNKTVITTTVKPVTLTPYHVNKRVDSESEFKHNNFPIYIPVDEMETSESQISFTNVTLHQNLAWAAEHKQPKAHIVPPKMVHESPLVNGGIPISPGEIITANSDVIVGKPAVGGPLTLAASGIKLHNPVNPPSIDSFVSANEQYEVKEVPNLSEQTMQSHRIDDSFDLRPPELPKQKPKLNWNSPRPSLQNFNHQNSQQSDENYPHLPPVHSLSGQMMKTEHIKTTSTVLGNHGRPAFLDYIPSFGKPHIAPIINSDIKPVNELNQEEEVPDNSPSSSEIVNTRVTSDGEYAASNPESINKPFLVDIQPSRVANVLIPHGSATALVFAGSSEPHKTGDYVDDPLPYPEPGYFGSFSIDAPQMTNVHNVVPNSNKQFSVKPNVHPSMQYKPNASPSFKDRPYRNEAKLKWKDSNRPTDYNKLPPPTSNQETHLQFGPQITAYNPDVYNPNNGDFEKYNPVRTTSKYKEGKEVIDKEYENYLAVPPPPPPKMHFKQDGHHDKNKQYNQRPVVHTKPVQDTKVFLNIQHPVPKPPKQEPLPPKVTSEIYFASQSPSSKPTPTYTIHIPPSPPTYDNSYNKVSNHNKQYVPSSTNIGQISNSFSVVSSPNFTNKSIFANDINNKGNTYTVTLNTATNVASNVAEAGQVIGSSVPVAIGTNDQLNADIPIGTNFAIRVEDGSSPVESYNLQSNQNSPVVYDQHGRVPEVTIGDNRWNESISENHIPKYESTIVGHHYYDQNTNDKAPNKDMPSPSIKPSQNSHANFPMMNEEMTSTYINDNIKPVTEEREEEIKFDQKRPAKLIPNIPTNSHGWYSSVLLNENNINNIKVEVTTRKIIPLSHDYNTDNIPDFGQKISSIGKPPSEFWAQNTPAVHNNFNIGQPFTKSLTTETPYVSASPQDTKPPFNRDYVISNFGTMQQPAYDIPIRDNSDETTTINTYKQTTEKVKPVYENSEEIYDGEEEFENSSENDGEVSQESMKVPVVSTSSEEPNLNNSNSRTEMSSPHNKVFKPSTNEEQDTNVRFVENNHGSQTEKPFGTYNKTKFQSNTIKPVYDNMKPKPFTINTATLDHQLHQPHWQINQLMINSTNMSYEENLDLNIGEEMSSASTSRPSTTRLIPHRNVEYENKYKRPQIPVYIFSHNNSRVVNDSNNIITSTVHIQDKKPLIVENITEKSTTPPISLTTLEFNRSSSEIIDLSPPPPTMDYNFKPSTNDEMIMGMSPPPPMTQASIPHFPQRNPSTNRPVLPIRTPPPYRNKPPKTLPPRLSTTQRPLRRPINRDEVSTYRPAYNIPNNIKRPIYNQDQPSSQLLPPPREPTSINNVPATIPVIPNVVFPTPISSGWLTSSGVDFSSSFDFGPTSVLFPTETPKPSRIPESDVSSTENAYSYEVASSSERFDEISSEKPEIADHNSKEISTESITKISSIEDQNKSDAIASESSHEETTTDKMKVIPLGTKNRTRKPYPFRNDEKKSSTYKYKVSSKPTNIIRPTKTLTRPEILYPTRHTSIRKIVRPLPTRASSVMTTNIIESSESSIDEDFIKPTEVLKEVTIPSTLQPEKTNILETSTSKATLSLDKTTSSLQPTHHAGNEIKISDEVVPTKTEFRTTVVTLTKTLSEPPRTISSIGYVNLTHTLTVTHTKTSLVSQSEGAITQTLILTNTHTSTRVDVVTEVHTQVQPTTIIETVTKHIPVPQVEPTPVQEIVTSKTKIALDDITMSSEENDNLIIRDTETTENIQKVDAENESDSDTFFVVMNKSQNGGKAPPIQTDIETGEYDITRNEQVNSNGVSQVLFGEILLAGTPFLETTNVVNPTGKFNNPK